MRALVGALLLLLMVLGAVSVPLAHELPTDVLIQILVKAEGNRLRVLVRVPVGSMQDIEFPQQGPGYLVISGGPGVAAWGVDVDCERDRGL